MSGAGKTTVLKRLEDSGYYCVDGIPIPMIEAFIEYTVRNSPDMDKVAIGIDSRTGKFDEYYDSIAQNISLLGIRCEILFLDADDKVLIKRYKETRRRHPYAEGERVNRGIKKEREILKGLKNHADYVIDTSKLLGVDLKKEIDRIFVEDQEYGGLFITVLSFGFKNGIPLDADLVFDVRFLPNPYYIDKLRALSGKDGGIADYLNGFEETGLFLDKLEDMLEFLIPNYIKEEKTQLIVGIGCTGGRHRSVMVAEAIYSRLKNKKKYGVRIEHRDLEKDKEHKRQE